MARSYPFDVITITSPNKAAASVAPINELRSYLRDNVFPRYGLSENRLPKLLSTCDPYGMKLGSGGGTIAALEYSDTASLDGENSNGAAGNLLIIHAGGDSSRCPTQMVLGKAWTSLPMSDDVVSNPTFKLVEVLSSFLRTLPKGSIVVAASDVLLSLSSECNVFDETQIVDFSNIDETTVVGIAVPAPLEVAKNHGVYIPDYVRGTNRTSYDDSVRCMPVKEFLQKPSIEEMKFDYDNRVGCVWNSPKAPQNEESYVIERALVDTGVVIFLPGAAKELRRMTKDKLSMWTEPGLTGYKARPPHKLELYTHIMYAFSTSGCLNGPERLSRTERKKKYLSDNDTAMNENTQFSVSLSYIFDCLCGVPLYMCLVSKGNFLHLGTTRELLDFILDKKSDYVSPKREGFSLAKVKRSLYFSLDSPSFDNGYNTAIVNSILSGNNTKYGEDSWIEHCKFATKTKVVVEDNCILSGIHLSSSQAILRRSLRIPKNTSIQQIPIRSEDSTHQMFVLVVFGVDDPIKQKCDSICGIDAARFLSIVNAPEHDFWHDGNCAVKSLWGANMHIIVPSNSAGEVDFSPLIWLFYYMQYPTSSIAPKFVLESLDLWKGLPKISLSQVSKFCDATYMYEIRRRTSLRIQFLCNTRRILLHQQHDQIAFHHFIECSSHDSSMNFDLLMRALDSVMVETFETKCFDIASRTIMLMSSIISHCNKMAIKHEFRTVEKAEIILFQKFSRQFIEEIKHGNTMTLQHSYKSFCANRNNLELYNAIDDACNIQECLERIAAAFTQKCVSKMIAKEGVSWLLKDPSFTNKKSRCWSFVKAPARIDLAGGWSDTPPITYEHGGAVAGIAVEVDMVKPLSARCRLLEFSSCILRTEQRDLTSGAIISTSEVQLATVNDLLDYDDPQAEAALLKATIVCILRLRAGGDFSLVDVKDMDISQFLGNMLGCKGYGIELVSSSFLPRGSGLGSSSILSGCVILSFIHAVYGQILGQNDLIDCVLFVEQLMTTSGGWQDQVMGLVPGAKIARSARNAIPPRVVVNEIKLGEHITKYINRQFFLIWTGTQRLAKNLLQNVLRRWNNRGSLMCKTIDDLVQGAEQCAVALKEGKLDVLGTLLTQYWEQKKEMAGDSAEPEDVQIMIDSLVNAQLILGASLCGAGGGGFLCVLVKENVCKDDIQNVFGQVKLKGNYSIHECNLSKGGVTCEYIDDSSSFGRTQHEP